jgi:hypothetical protein
MDDSRSVVHGPWTVAVGITALRRGAGQWTRAEMEYPSLV